MANNDSKTAETPNPMEALAAAISQGMAQALDRAKPKEFDFAEWANRPENRDPFTLLRRPVYQHGQPIQIHGASDDTIKHLNELEAGEYFGGRVTVSVLGNAPHEQVHINYPITDASERMKNYILFSSFSDLVAKIAKEQKARAAK